MTSCCRFDLLEKTLRSFYAQADVAPQELIVVEDSAEDQVRSVVDGLGVPAQTLVRGARLGQMQAIDHAYAKVKTPLIFIARMTGYLPAAGPSASLQGNRRAATSAW